MATLPNAASPTLWGSAYNTWLQVEHDANGIHESQRPTTSPSSAVALTNIEGDYIFSNRNADIEGYDIYQPIFPTITHYDTTQSVLEIVNGSTILHAAATSGYVKVLDASTNGVCLFGCGYVDIDSGAIWGINTLLMDDAVIGAGVETGRQLYNELDFNVQHTGTTVVGLSIGGNSTAQPGTATGFIANTLGTGMKWQTGFATLDGTCTNAIGIAAASAAGADVNSQLVIFSVYDSGSNPLSAYLQAQTSSDVEYMILGGVTDPFNMKVVGGRYLSDVGAFGAADTTPSVAGGHTFTTDGTDQTLTDFTLGIAGQQITVISTDATTFAFSGNLSGSSASIVTASGDSTTWVTADGTTWTLTGFVDISKNNSSDASPNTGLYGN